MPDPYMYGETSGIKKAVELRPKALGNMLGRADNVLLILGSESGKYPEKILKGIVEKTEATVYKTESSGSNDLNIEADKRLGLMEILNALSNGSAGEFDYILFAGIPYHIGTRVFSGLRAYGVETVVSLDYRHHQYAGFSFKNTPDLEKWEKELNELLANL